MWKRLAGVKKTTPQGIEKQIFLANAGFTLALGPLKVFCFFILQARNCYKDECQLLIMQRFHIIHEKCKLFSD
jgi:hypothetical protein